MVTTVRQVWVRYVRPAAEDEERLRATCAELQAVSILRLAQAADGLVGPEGEGLPRPPEASRNAAGKALTSIAPPALMCASEPVDGDR